MVKRAFIFPGQGAQCVGMAKDLYDAVAESRKVFDTAQSAVDFNITKVCFEGPLDELSRTDISQPAILTASIAVLKAMEVSGIKSICDYTAGLSLGEYSALVAAGSLGFQEAIKVVAKRGRFMQQASEANPGGMLTILGLDIQQVTEITQETQTYIANLNCPQQIVISGKHDNLKTAESLAKQRGAKRALLLKVSGPFHTQLMQEASQSLKNELEKTNIKEPGCKVVFNVTGKTETDPEKIKIDLFKQVSQTTYWQKSVEYMAAEGVELFIEIGPGQVLKGLLKRINPQLKVISISSLEDIENAKKELGI
jgi:[acyl-carrier-protein] S-malonyltransferase